MKSVHVEVENSKPLCVFNKAYGPNSDAQWLEFVKESTAALKRVKTSDLYFQKEKKVKHCREYLHKNII